MEVFRAGSSRTDGAKGFLLRQPMLKGENEPPTIPSGTPPTLTCMKPFTVAVDPRPSTQNRGETSGNADLKLKTLPTRNTLSEFCQEDFVALSVALKNSQDLVAVQKEVIQQLSNDVAVLQSNQALTLEFLTKMQEHQEDLQATEILMSLSQRTVKRKESSEGSEQKAKRRRGKLPEKATHLLKQWLFNHRSFRISL